MEVSGRDPPSRSRELLNDSLAHKVVPSVDLPVSVGLWNFCLELILVACNDEFLSIVLVVIRAVHDEYELGHVSAVRLFPLKVVDGPSKYIGLEPNQKVKRYVVWINYLP